MVNTVAAEGANSHIWSDGVVLGQIYSLRLCHSHCGDRDTFMMEEGEHCEIGQQSSLSSLWCC